MLIYPSTQACIVLPAQCFLLLQVITHALDNSHLSTGPDLPILVFIYTRGVPYLVRPILFYRLLLYSLLLSLLKFILLSYHPSKQVPNRWGCWYCLPSENLFMQLSCNGTFCNTDCYT